MGEVEIIKPKIIKPEQMKDDLSKKIRQYYTLGVLALGGLLILAVVIIWIKNRF